MFRATTRHSYKYNADCFTTTIQLLCAHVTRFQSRTVRLLIYDITVHLGYRILATMEYRDSKLTLPCLPMYRQQHNVPVFIETKSLLYNTASLVYYMCVVQT